MPSDYLTSDDARSWAPVPTDARISYGPAEEHFGELRLPRGTPERGRWPVAVVLHGGCWLSLADHRYTAPLAAALTEAGWATWNLEFRVLDQEGGAWPGIFRDVAAGVDHLRAVARDHPVDAGRVVTVGHSSGGHLALWAASRHRISPGADLHDPDPLPVRGTVGLAAIADLTAYHALDIGWDDGCGDAVARLLGGAPAEVPERLAQACPAALRPTGVPHLLLTGGHDRAVPPEHGEACARAGRTAGDRVEHHLIDSAAHFAVVAPWTEAGQRAMRLMGRFLEARSG